ncbi:MAG: DUF192 domain-containing protein [Steroidobacteraceae bacterium]
MMKTTLRGLLLVLMMATSLVNSACADTGSVQPALEPLSNFPQTSLTVLTQNGRQHTLQIWMADTNTHRQQGLMLVKSLPPNTGMLFIFDRPQRIQMWMKNTLIPLDMVFIDANGRIDSIATNTTPLSLNIIASKNAVLGVLDLAGGSSTKLGIRAGAFVLNPAFASVGGSR